MEPLPIVVLFFGLPIAIFGFGLRRGLGLRGYTPVLLAAGFVTACSWIGLHSGLVLPPFRGEKVLLSPGFEAEPILIGLSALLGSLSGALLRYRGRGGRDG